MSSESSKCCVVCAEAAGSGDSAGLTCADGHFCCADCLNGLALAELSAESLRQKRCVGCPHRGALAAGGRVGVCPAKFTVRQLQAVLRPDVFAQVLADALSVLDAVGEELKKKDEELEKAGGAAAARMAEAEKAAAGQARADRINTLRQGLVEAHLVLRCPRCRAAFLDYTGCDALVCSRPGCACGFCALCLKDCGADAHGHLASAHGGYSRGEVAFKQAHSKRQRKGVADAIAALREPPDVKAELAKALEGDFADAPKAAGVLKEGGGMLRPLAGALAAAAAGFAAGAAALLGGGGGGGMQEWQPGWGLGPAEVAALPRQIRLPPGPKAVRRRQPQARPAWRDPHVAVATAALDRLEREGDARQRIAQRAAAAAAAVVEDRDEEDADLRQALAASLEPAARVPRAAAAPPRVPRRKQPREAITVIDDDAPRPRPQVAARDLSDDSDGSVEVVTAPPALPHKRPRFGAAPLAGVFGAAAIDIDDDLYPSPAAAPLAGVFGAVAIDIDDDLYPSPAAARGRPGKEDAAAEVSVQVRLAVEAASAVAAGPRQPAAANGAEVKVAVASAVCIDLT